MDVARIFGLVGLTWSKKNWGAQQIFGGGA